MEIAIESPPVSSGPQPDHARVSTARIEKFVTFQIGENTYAVEAPAVAEVVHPLPITPLPDQPRGLLGISPLRGEAIAVVDARGLLAEETTKVPTQKAKQIVLKPSSDGHIPVTFLVDRIGEIAAIDIGNVEPILSCEFLLGETYSEGRPMRILDHSKLAGFITP